MKVLYDHYVFSYLKFGGISKYIAELMRNIPREYWETSTLFTNNEHFIDNDLSKSYKVFPNVDFRYKERLMFELNMPYTKWLLRKSEWDVFHPTWFADRYVDDLNGKPMVVTIHDLIYDLFFTDSPVGQRVINKGKISARKANKIIAVSQNTKKDIVNLWGIPEEKIEVIYNGVEKQKYANLPVSRLIDSPYLFFVGGGRALNKNFDHLLEAFSIVVKKHKNLKLVCSGNGFRSDELRKINDLKIEKNVIHFYADNKQMAQLYRDAEMLVLPSYYEGFGLPVLEAMVYDCPVVISNASCLPEIGGEAAIYFNPYDTDDIAHQITCMLEDEDLRNEKKQLEKLQLDKFSWEKCAAEHLNLYRSLI